MERLIGWSLLGIPGAGRAREGSYRICSLLCSSCRISVDCLWYSKAASINTANWLTCSTCSESGKLSQGLCNTRGGGAATRPGFAGKPCVFLGSGPFQVLTLRHHHAGRGRKLYVLENHVQIYLQLKFDLTQ